MMLLSEHSRYRGALAGWPGLGDAVGAVEFKPRGSFAQMTGFRPTG
ncbi:hypothetical protein [Duganella sp. P38]